MAEFTSIGKGLGGAIENYLSECKIEPYKRKELPGIILYGLSSECLHALIWVGVNNYLQSMQVRIFGVTRENRLHYERLVVDLFDHMTANKPVELLKELDAEEFIAMSEDSNAVTEWINLIHEYVNHITIARNIRQDEIIGEFEQNDNWNVAKLKMDLKNMLRTISDYADEELAKAEAIYTLKRAKYYDNKELLTRMESALNELIELTYQEINLNDEHFEEKSELAPKVKDRFNKSTVSVIDTITENSSILSENLIDALLKAKIENEKAIKEIE